MSAGEQKSRFGCAAIAVMAVGGAAVIYGQEVSWITDDNGSWHDGPNWSTGMPPQILEAVTIDRSNAAVRVTFSQGGSTIAGLSCTETLVMTNGTITSLANLDTSALEMRGGQIAGLVSTVRLNVLDSLIWSGGAFVLRGGAIAHNAFEISGSGDKQVAGAVVNLGNAVWIDSGNISVGGSAFLRNGAGATFEIQNNAAIEDPTGQGFVENFGELRKVSGGVTRVEALVVNNGVLRASAGTFDFFGGYTQDAGQTRLEGGAITSQFIIDFFGGELTGDGVVMGDVNNAAFVSPGAGIGTITIQGNYAQGTTGTLRAEIGGTQPSEVDLLNVSGSATLSGTVEVTLVEGFIPSLGEAYEVMRFASHSGRIEAVTGTNLPPGFFMAPRHENESLTLVAFLTSALWVDFNSPNSGQGTFEDPYNTLDDAVTAVAPGGAIVIKPGVTAETPTIAKAMTLNAFGGSAVVGQQ